MEWIFLPDKKKKPKMKTNAGVSDLAGIRQTKHVRWIFATNGTSSNFCHGERLVSIFNHSSYSSIDWIDWLIDCVNVIYQMAIPSLKV